MGWFLMDRTTDSDKRHRDHGLPPDWPQQLDPRPTEHRAHPPPVPDCVSIVESASKWRMASSDRFSLI